MSQDLATVMPAPKGAAESGGQYVMDLDITIFLQLGLFIALLAILNVVLFRLFLALVEKRHERTFGRLVRA
jgi:hypothetical protein